MDPCSIFLVILELFRKLLKLSSNDRPVVLSFQISFLCSPLMSSSMSSHSLPCPRSTDATALGFVSVCPGNHKERRYYRNWSVVKFRRICCNKSDLYICGMSDIVKMVLNWWWLWSEKGWRSTSGHLCTIIEKCGWSGGVSLCRLSFYYRSIYPWTFLWWTFLVHMCISHANNKSDCPWQIDRWTSCDG